MKETTHNHYPESLERLASQINAANEGLRAGRLASDVANALHASGLSTLELMIVFRAATGASIGDLKMFGQWWSPQGVTDAPAFDAWAAKAFKF